MAQFKVYFVYSGMNVHYIVIEKWENNNKLNTNKLKDGNEYDRKYINKTWSKLQEKRQRKREYKSPTQGKNKVLILYAIYIKILIMIYWELLPMNLTM